MKLKNAGTYLLTACLALANIVWFATFTLGMIKMILIVLMILMNIGLLVNYKNYYGLVIFILIFTILIFVATCSSQQSSNDNIYWLYGFLENYLFLTLGYSYYRNGKKVSMVFQSIIPFTCFFCLLIVLNFITGYPDWVSPIAQESYDNAFYGGYINAEISPMFSTGFGIARTGWATSLSSYLPLTLLLINNKKIFFPTYILIAATVIISASRGGLLTVVIISFISFLKSNMMAAKKILSFTVIVLIAIAILALSDFDTITTFLRLSVDNGEDFSSGRTSQYALIPQMVRDAGFSGLGIHGTKDYLSKYGLYWDLHNTYFRTLCECGWIVGLFVFIASIKLFILIIKDIEQCHNLSGLCLPLILISGLLAGLWEPQAVFGSVNWWSLWWFALGVYLAQKDCTSNANAYLSYR